MHQARQPNTGSSQVRNYRLLLQYDGTEYAGWQIQRTGATIQQTLTQAIERITGEPIHLCASGRTDAGVHARGQVANFHTARVLDSKSWRHALNHMLPADIRVRRVSRTHSDFHARKDAVSKLYVYQIFRQEVLPPWHARYCLHWPFPLKISAMQQAAQRLLGEHDMRSFTAAGAGVKQYVRIVTRSEFLKRGALLLYRIEANGFMRHMVRAIVGTLLEVGRGRFSVDDFSSILAAQNRSQAGPTAPPCGLFLDRVFYRRRARSL